MAVKRFTCNDCGSKCATKAKLNAHKKLHTLISEDKPEFSCDGCEKKFTSFSILKRHRKNCKYACEDLVIGLKENHEHQNSINSEKMTNGKSYLSATKVAGQDVFPVNNDDTLTGNNGIGEENVAHSIHKMCSKVQTLLESSKYHPTGIFSSGSITKSALSKDTMSMNQLIKSSLQSFNGKKISLPQLSGKKTRKPVCRNKGQPPNLSTTAGKQSNRPLEKFTLKNSVLQKSRSHTMGTRGISRRNDSNQKKLNSCIDEIKGPATSSNSELSIQNSGNGQELGKTDAHSIANETKLLDTVLEKQKNNKSPTEDLECDNSVEKEISVEIIASQEAQVASPVSSDVNEKKQFTCPECSKSFSRKYHLDRHLKLSPCSGLPPLSFPCQLCDRVYTRKDNLREHLRQHTGEPQRIKKHRCNYCNKAFHGQSLLTIHIRTHTGEKPFACDFCNKKFPSVGALSKHRRTHTGERPFECNECGLKFSLKGTLKRHMRVHTGVRPHKCKFCGKQFIQIGGLKAHMFYHTGENGFKCEECGKIFNRKARLQMHNLYVHIKHRPFVCEHCSKSFTRKEDLNRHNVLHTGEKPFKCPTCSKTFAIKPSLKLHLLTHTKEEPRSCHECGRAFIRKDCLLRHMRKRHRDLLDKILLDEKDEKYGDSNLASSRMLGEEDLCENIAELLSLLVEESTLTGFGWPNKPVDEVLEAVIRRCGHTPVSPEQYSYMDRMRENAKLLFTVVIDDNAVKTLLNNQTVDEVILHVLRLAKT